MIHEVAGDILLSKAHAIAHGVAPNDPMNQGLALSLRERYPAMHKDFHHWCSIQHPQSGEIWAWAGAGGARIISLLTQEGGYGHGGRPGRASVKHVSDSLRALAKLVAQEGIESIALPRLATGVGGLDWSEVKPVIESRLEGLGIPVYVYTTFHAGVAAKEPA